jgi:uncharacterized protein YdcH (DUF465 family)
VLETNAKEALRRLEMPIEHHPLDQEFPEYVRLMRQLHTMDEGFRDMFEEYTVLDSRIYNIDEDITPAADHYAEDLKKRRVYLKDRLYNMLVKAKND